MNQLLNFSKRVSEVDIATKYIFPAGDELVYVDNGSGKDIFCIPSQSGCKLGCKFCFLTSRSDQEVRQMEAPQALEMINTAFQDLNLTTGNKTLLISFMGMGEPLLSPGYIFEVSKMVVDEYKDRYDQVRFGLATIVPSVRLLNDLAQIVEQPTKVHWSLHNPFDHERSLVMPNASSIESSAKALADYREKTGNPIEIHYTVFDGNDGLDHADELAKIALAYNFPVKFLKFSERPDPELITSKVTDLFIHRVSNHGVTTETYAPPGHDIQGACGEFEHNFKKTIHTKASDVCESNL